MPFFHSRAIALACLLLGPLAGCSDNVVDRFGETGQGNVVFASERACTLRVEASSGTMVLLVPFEGDGVRLSFQPGNIVVDRGTQTASFGFLVSRMDGSIAQLAQESIRYLDDGANSIFTADAPAWVVTDLAELKNISFVWDGTVASMASPRAGWAEEAELLADCLGKPLAEVTPVAG